MNRWVPLLVAGLAALVALAAIVLQASSGAQPWGQLLSDNFVFARSIPFTLGLGVAFGAFRAFGRRQATTQRRRGDGALRRFAPGTASMHWLTAVGFLLALVTGTWQYLKGLLAVESPVDMPLVYRGHYIGATLLLFATAHFLTYWGMDGRRPLAVPAGQRIRHLRGATHELPKPIGGAIGALLGLDMRRQPPPVGEFTYYEKTVSFPLWVVLLAAIVVTGILKAMRYVYPIPGDVLWWVSAVHVGAMVALAAKLLDHLRYVLAPSRWPLLVASFTTWVSQAYVARRHPAWLEQVERPAREAPAGAPATGPVLQEGGVR
jgi:cytochrome b subunit of formate dehydrogenase